MIQLMKFGGTSLANQQARKKAIEIIKKEVELNHKVVVVVSAMGREKEPYSTRTLSQFSEYLSEKDKDRLISLGEKLSSLVFENECLAAKLMAISCTVSESGILTDDTYQKANVIHVNPMMIIHYLKEADVVIVPGFLGMSITGNITTLGKGGSDKTAMLLASALNLHHVFIYTDVDGIYHEDPKLNPKSKKYETMSFDECIDLVNSGACVMMKESVELAKKRNISFTVKSTFVDKEGTKVL